MYGLDADRWHSESEGMGLFKVRNENRSKKLAEAHVTQLFGLRTFVFRSAISPGKRELIEREREISLVVCEEFKIDISGEEVRRKWEREGDGKE